MILFPAEMEKTDTVVLGLLVALTLLISKWKAKID